MTIISIICLLLLANYVESDMFTSVTSLEELLNKEGSLIKILEDYINAEKEKIINLARYATFFNQQHDKARQYGSNYAQNPINAFKLLKRMSVDWSQVEELIRNSNSPSYLDTIENVKSNTFPTNMDLEGAVTGLHRLQVTYSMNTSSIANGFLNGVQYDTELNVADCYLLGHQNYEMGNYYQAILWMNETKLRLKRENDDSVDRLYILYVIYDSARNLGDYGLAMYTVNRWLQIDPSNEDAQRIKLVLRRQIMERSGSAITMKHYREVCTDKNLLPAEVTSKLKCRYVDNNNPYLRIGPFKLEEAFLDPDIFIFHDVLGDREIESLKKYSADTLERSRVGEGDSGVVYKQRISQSGYIREENYKFVRNIIQRVNHMTKLDRRSYETLQVANYGIGGYYYSHHDFAGKDEGEPFPGIGLGNRIATILFYLSDVEQGGATAFPVIDAAVWPKKGSAVFWYNLFPSGDGDYRTLHSACPVLVGSKWVSNLWIHEHYQEFSRPCTLERPPEHLTI